MPDRQRRKYAPRLPREQRREQLLDCALTVLSDCPLHELSMEAVAETAGVGKPLLYTAFRTRAELVTALLTREHLRGLAQVRAAIPHDLSVGTYSAAVSAFLQSVLENPIRWRLILTVPDSAPRDYRAALRRARSEIVAEIAELAGMSIGADSRMAEIDMELLSHTLLSFAEMLGRLAVNDPGHYPRERLETYAVTAMTLFAGARES